MELELKLKGDYYEEGNELRLFLDAQKIAIKNDDARDLIRHRLKYTEGLSDGEVRFLEELQETLFYDRD